MSRLRYFSVAAFVHLTAVEAVVDHNSVIVDRTAPTVRDRMLAEIVDRIDVGSVNLPRHLVGFALDDGTREMVMVLVHYLRKVDMPNPL